MAYSRSELEAALVDAASRYGIDPAIAYRQIQQESSFNPNARSSSNAQGIAQFIPGTAARFGLSNPYDPFASFEAWGQYMSEMLAMFGGRYDLALAGYNSGENRSEYAAAAREGRCVRWEIMPARVQSETRNYVAKILGVDCAITGATGNGDGVAACFEGDPCFVDYGASDYLKDFFSGANPAGSSTSKFLLIGGLALVAVLVLKR